MKITHFVKESPAGTYRAELHEGSGHYYIEYYGPAGDKIKTEKFEGRSIKQVSDIAESWINGIQVLNG
jgi:hypothetical protein